MVYISVINTQTLQITFLHDIDLLWAAFHMPERRIHIGITYSYSNLNNPVTYFHLKNYRLCRDLNPGSPQYQADMLPIELS